MTIEELEEALSEVLPGFSIETDNSGELIIHTGLREDEDGDLVEFESEEEDPTFDPDVEPLEDEDVDD